jgi:hypothetical protein
MDVLLEVNWLGYRKFLGCFDLAFLFPVLDRLAWLLFVTFSGIDLLAQILVARYTLFARNVRNITLINCFPLHL